MRDNMSLLSEKSRKILQSLRLVGAVTCTAVVVAIWLQAPYPKLLILAFGIFGLLGAVATLAIRADNEKLRKVR